MVYSNLRLFKLICIRKKYLVREKNAGFNKKQKIQVFYIRKYQKLGVFPLRDNNKTRLFKEKELGCFNFSILFEKRRNL